MLVRSLRSLRKDRSIRRGAFVSEIALALLDTIDVMVAYWDEDRACRFANDAYRRWFGRSREEMIGLSLPDLLGSSYEQYRPFIDAAFDGQKLTFHRETIDARGARRISLTTYTPHVVRGKVRGIFVHASASDGSHGSSRDALETGPFPALAAATAQNDAELDSVIRIPHYAIDPIKRRAYLDGRPVELTEREFSVVVYFFARLGDVVTRAEILRDVFRLGPRVISRTLDTHISRIRRKLSLDGALGVRLVSVYQTGYRLIRS